MDADTPIVRLATSGDNTPTSASALSQLHDRPDAPTVDDLHNHPAARQQASQAAPLLPLLVDMAGLSQLLARSEASLYRDDSAGRLPAGLKIGASKRWRYSEIVAWVEAGMPDRRTWEAMKGNKDNNGRTRR